MDSSRTLVVAGIITSWLPLPAPPPVPAFSLPPPPQPARKKVAEKKTKRVKLRDFPIKKLLSVTPNLFFHNRLIHLFENYTFALRIALNNTL